MRKRRTMLTLSPELSTWLVSSLLLVAAGLAAARPLPSSLGTTYFLVEFAASLGLALTLRFVTIDSEIYGVLFCWSLLAVRALACVLAAQHTRWPALTAVPFAGILLWMGINGIAGAPTVDQWICLFDGVIVTAAGLALALTAPFSYHRNLYGTLAMLWMFLGIFDFGYALQPYGKWRELNDSLLPVMVIGAFGWIAMSQWSVRWRVAGKRIL